MENIGFIGYEYVEISAKREIESFYLDYYPSFGWQFENRTLSIKGLNYIQLKFKRNRKINNKIELNKLQKQFEKVLEEIKKLEFSKILKASTIAYIVGVIGTAFMAGSVFSIVAENVLLCAILGVIAFVGWSIPYLFYKNISEKMTEQVEPLIEEKYDKINDICEKALKLSKVLYN